MRGYSTNIGFKYFKNGDGGLNANKPNRKSGRSKSREYEERNASMVATSRETSKQSLIRS